MDFGIKIEDINYTPRIVPNLNIEINFSYIKSVERKSVYGGGKFDILSIYPTCFGNT